jgi:hypothetical protein
MNTTTENKKVPSKEDVMKYLKDQLGVKRLQVELQELNAKYAAAFLAERKSQMELAYISQKQQEAMIPHVVTEEDLKNNPEWADQGISIGDTIGIPNTEFAKEERAESYKTTA